jgi:hypothetical protein
MTKKNDDLIWQATGVGNYDFSCWLGKTLEDKHMPHYTSVCLNRFKTFYAENYPGRQIYIYKWDMDKLVTRWNSAILQKQLGKLSATTLKSVLTRWYTIGKQHGMLPKNFLIPKESNRFYIKNTGGIPPSLFYVYITHLRQVWEEPHFVYNFITLVDKYKLNVWSSYVVASAMSIYNCNHHVLSVSARNSMGVQSAKIGMMFDMRDYFAAPHKRDRRKMKSMGEGEPWGIHGRLGGGIEQAINVVDILADIKRFNKVLEMPREKGMKEFANNIKIEVLFNSLHGLGFRTTQDYYEPWWLILRTDHKKTADDLIGKIKKTLEGYVYKRLSYGVELRLKPKMKYLSVAVATKRKNFKGPSRQLGQVDKKHYVDLTRKG